MLRATMTTKGQLTVPESVREDLGLTPGATVVFTRTAAGGYELSTGRRHGLLDLYGTIGGDRSVTLEDMDEAIAAGAADSVS